MSSDRSTLKMKSFRDFRQSGGGVAAHRKKSLTAPWMRRIFQV
jgi:hypothetical protein